MLRSTFLNLAAVLAVSFLLVGIAGAATPESGAITVDQAKVEFSGGPFVGTNITPLVMGQAGENALCVEGELCDVFRFEVNLKKANLEDDIVMVSVEWPDIDGVAAEVPDFDVYLYDDTTGELVTSAATADNPEVIVLTAENRKYRLEIIPFAPMAQSYAGRVEYVKFEEDKSGVLGFAGALNPLVLGGFALALLLRRRRRHA